MTLASDRRQGFRGFRGFSRYRSRACACACAPAHERDYGSSRGTPDSPGTPASDEVGVAVGPVLHVSVRPVGCVESGRGTA